MPKYGAHLKFNIIFLISLISTVLKFATAESVNLQHPRYDFIDVAKETNSERSKGQTTRIFTTGDELDETFWLKYLGEEFRNAVHLQVDNENNVVQIKSKHPQELQQNITSNIENKVEKRTRFVRQPAEDNKQIPVESLYKQDDTPYPTEKPENFNKNLTTSEHKIENNKKSLKNKKKLLLHNKNKQEIFKVKPPSPLKALHKPIVVNLPETKDSKHLINGEAAPVVVLMPPVIYHQKADLYTGQIPNLPSSKQESIPFEGLTPSLHLSNPNTNLYYEQIPNLPLNNQEHHPHTYTTSTHTQSHLNAHEAEVSQQKHIPQTDYISTTHNQIQQPYSYQTLPIALMSLTQLPAASFAPSTSR